LLVISRFRKAGGSNREKAEPGTWSPEPRSRLRPSSRARMRTRDQMDRMIHLQTNIKTKSKDIMSMGDPGWEQRQTVAEVGDPGLEKS
jgi:hypothetical protein